jgi:ELWxxDGT repeat protein
MRLTTFALLLSLFGAALSGCSISASLSGLPGDAPSLQKITVSLDITSLTLTEGSSALINVTLSDRRDVPTVVDVSLSSVRNDVGDDFMPVVSSVTIPAHSLSAPLLLTSKQDTIYETNEDFQLYLYVSDPSLQIERAQTTVTIIDDDPMPVASFTTTTSNVNEGAGTGTVQVTLDRASAFPITIPYTVADGTATAADYTMASGSVTFLPGETTKSLSYTVIDDAIAEPPETFTVQLGASSSAVTLGANTTHTVTVVDNDFTNLTIDDVSVNKGGNLVFTVTLSVASLSTVTFDWATTAGTAVDGVNYTGASGSASVAPGALTKTIVVSTLSTAALCDADKTLTVNLSNAANAAIADGTGVGTITDSSVPTLSLANGSGSEAGVITMTASLSAACPTKNVTFNWSTTSGTATAGVDFNTITGQSATIPAGSTSVTLTTTPINDTIHEADETFTVTLSNLVNATAGTVTATGTIYDDDDVVPYQLKEFNSIANPVSTLVLADGRVLFSNTDVDHGTELWISDGTDAGTYMLKDLNPGDVNSSPLSFYLNTTNNVVLFQATTAANGREVWRTDGTAAGTYLLLDAVPGATGIISAYMLGQLGGLTIFVTAYSSTSAAVWATDGTTAGTVQLIDSSVGVDAYSATGVVYGGKLYMGIGSPAGRGLWRTDGTKAGTVLVKQIAVNDNSDQAPVSFTLFNGKFVFTGTTPTQGNEPWVSDGTSAGTVILKDVAVGNWGSQPYNYTALGSKLAFNATDFGSPNKFYVSDGTPAGTTGFNAGGVVLNSVLGVIGTKAVFSPGITDNEPWVTDGTQAGTVRLKDINVGASVGSIDSTTSIAFNGLVLFTADDGTHGLELWATDGTAAGTALVSDIYAGASGSDPQGFTVVGTSVVFSAVTALGRELWITDGTAAGTHLFADINPGSAGSNPNNIIARNATHFFFTAYNPTTKTATVYDGDITAGTVTALDHATVTTYGSGTHGFSALGSSVIFDAVDNGPGNSLWKTDGTAAGTVKIKDVYPSADCTDISQLTTVGSSVFFKATTASGEELWATDGTTAGTVQMKDIYAGASSSSPANFTPITNNKMIFSATTSTQGKEPWVTDGTSAGTVILKDMAAGATSGLNSQYPFVYQPTQGLTYISAIISGSYTVWVSSGTAASTTQLTALGTSSYQYLVVPLGAKTIIGKYTGSGSNYDLWVSDGTNAGTVQFSSGVTGYFSAATDGWYHAVVGSNFYFAGTSAAEGTELWVTDGTTGGTHIVKDIVAGTGSPAYPSLQVLIPFGNNVVFTVEDDVWISDGTTAGTRLLISGKSMKAYNLTAAVVNGRLLMALQDSVDNTQNEMWVTDGTTDGTHLLKKFKPSGVADDAVTLLTVFGSRVYFVANDGVHGTEPWVTDGTTEGTHMAADIYPGTYGSAPSTFTVANGKLYFLATTPLGGTEVWLVDP